MATEKMEQFLQDSLGLSSSELETTHASVVRQIIADKYGRSVEITGHNTYGIDCSDDVLAAEGKLISIADIGGWYARDQLFVCYGCFWQYF